MIFALIYAITDRHFSSVVMVNRAVTCLTQGSLSVPSLPVCYVHVSA